MGKNRSDLRGNFNQPIEFFKSVAKSREEGKI